MHEPIPPEINAIGRLVYDAAFAVHRAFGPGLLESTYKVCLAQHLLTRGVAVQTEVPVPVFYEGLKVPIGYAIDLLVGGCVIVEVKSVLAMHPVFDAQLLTYMKLAEKRLGYLINFNEVLLKDGIKRFVL